MTAKNSRTMQVKHFLIKKYYRTYIIKLKFVIVYTAQKMKFSIRDFFSNCDQIRRKLRIWSHLLKESLMGNFFFLCSDIVEKLIWSWLKTKGKIFQKWCVEQDIFQLYRKYAAFSSLDNRVLYYISWFR